MPKDDLLATAEVAAIVGRDVATVNRWAVSGRLPVARKLPGVRGAHLFHRKDVERLVVQGRKDSAA